MQPAARGRVCPANLGWGSVIRRQNRKMDSGGKCFLQFKDRGTEALKTEETQLSSQNFPRLAPSSAN